MVAGQDPLQLFSEPVRAWFRASFPEPTAAQTGAWGPISRGEHTLLCAPTGSGKTLAAFLWALDVLGRSEPEDGPGDDRGQTSVVYLSPLRALAVDVEKNLRAPLRGIELAAARAGQVYRPPSIGVRTGDTTAAERRALLRHPPDILITTPESLFLMLTSRARGTLVGARRVIVDEIHALAPTKRGAHLAVSLERLAHLVRSTTGEDPQRIGLSATQRPLEVVAAYLGGGAVHGEDRRPRPVTVVDAGVRKELDLQVVVPVADMTAPGEPPAAPLQDPPGGAPPSPPGAPAEETSPPRPGSIWSAVHPRLLELVESHRSTLVFVNARRLAERLASRLNELAHEAEPRHTGGEATGSSVGPGEVELVKAHHGSLSRERRLLVEDELKRGELRGLVATSSLELGIDMGAVDLVVQVASPGSVAAGLQRIGRAGHGVGIPSRGRIFPKHRADLLEAAAVARGMSEGRVERTSVPRNPLDVLAQQLVAIVAMGPDPSSAPLGGEPPDSTDPSGQVAPSAWHADDLYDLVRGADNFSQLSRGVFEAVLDMLAGRYPAEEFADLRPRLVWDRLTGAVRPRAGAQRLAVTNAGTIPDRGLFGVFLPDGTRVGELDEEMVYESRVGETFLLGASSWQIQEITFERVVVVPAPGRPGKMPFWHGDGPGRSAELGRAMGELVRTLRGLPVEQARAELTEHHHLDGPAADNLLAYLDEQAGSTGAVPDDRTIVVERFRDEIGDWRVCVHTPFGSRVHAPWATVLRNRLAEHSEGETLGVEVLWSDDGIVMRLPDAADRLPVELLLPDPDEVEAEVVAALPSTSAFAARFRECAARALLLPRRRPDRRTPLWQQRQRAADLLAVASRYPSFPILLEATREMCNDVYDLPALRQVLAEVRSRRIRTVAVDTAGASPFARSLLFGWIAVYMYEGDAPLAERRAAALALDRELLGELLGTEELRSLLDAEVLAAVELELQRLTEDRAARDPDELHDLLRVLGPLTPTELSARVSAPAVAASESPGRADPTQAWVDELLHERRALEVVLAGETRLAAAEDAGRLRDGLGVQVPMGLPAQFTEPCEHPLADLVRRFARTHVPFTTEQVARRLGLPAEVAGSVLRSLEDDGAVVRGELTPGGVDLEWCDAEVLRLLRRRSMAALRREVEPVPAGVLARFLPRWQGVGATHRGPDAIAEAVAVLQGAPLVASTLEADVLGVRVPDLRSSELDLLFSGGEVVWLGAGALGAHDGRVRLVFRDQADLLVPQPSPAPEGAHHDVLREHLAGRGASFWAELVEAVASARLPTEESTVLEALWDLVWAGEVTNDTLAPLRARVAGGLQRRAPGARSRRRPDLRGIIRSGPPSAVGRWALTASLLPGRSTATERAAAQAAQLLERYGILTREMALGEGVEGGFAGVYPVLKMMEERGQLRRGYFVEGLGAAQFALAGAVDRLRAESGRRGDVEAVPRLPWEPAPAPSDRPDVWVLAATDPAQPFGGVLGWPPSVGRPSRSAGAFVVLVGGDACAYLERGGRSLLTFPAAREHHEWPEALPSLVRDGRVRRLRIERVDDERAGVSPLADALRAVGFTDGYKGLSLQG